MVNNIPAMSLLSPSMLHTLRRNPNHSTGTPFLIDNASPSDAKPPAIWHFWRLDLEGVLKSD